MRATKRMVHDAQLQRRMLRDRLPGLAVQSSRPRTISPPELSLVDLCAPRLIPNGSAYCHGRARATERRASREPQTTAAGASVTPGSSRDAARALVIGGPATDVRPHIPATADRSSRHKDRESDRGGTAIGPDGGPGVHSAVVGSMDRAGLDECGAGTPGEVEVRGLMEPMGPCTPRRRDQEH